MSESSDSDGYIATARVRPRSRADSKPTTGNVTQETLAYLLMDYSIYLIFTHKCICVHAHRCYVIGNL